MESTLKAKALTFEYVDLDEIVERDGNPKDHDLGAIIESFQRFGFVAPVQLEGESTRLLAGHGRVRALKAMRDSGEPSPARVLARNGKWFVPAVRGAVFDTDLEAMAYAIADNRTTELGGWMEQKLAEALRSLPSLEGVGYDQEDLDALLASLAPAPPEPNSIEPPANPITKPGDLWLLGEHRLLCGDATNSDDMAKLLAGAKPRLCVTDPPYGVEYDPAWRDEAAARGHLNYAARRVGQITNDNRVDWGAAWGLIPSEVLYTWYASLYAKEVQSGVEAAGFELRSQLVWAKPGFVISRGHYHWQHECCLYAVRKGRDAGWIGDRSQTTLWAVPLDENVPGGHSAQKPVELMTRPITNHSGDVLDPFVGSGTTLMAAEGLGRRCFAMDIDPGYVDVVVRRWEEATGGRAERRSDG